MAFITGIPIRNSIHTDFSRESGVWANYRNELTGDYIDENGTGSNFHEFADGSFREYNRKLNDLNISGSESIFLEPYDAGFRYKGDPLIARFPSGIVGGFSCRNIGFGGPIMRVRRSTDNTEVDVRGDNDGVLSLKSPIIDYRENLVRFSETFSSWNNVNITLTAGQVDAFGGTNASIFTPDGTGTDRREILTTVVANQTYNGSVFVKAGTSDNFQVQFVDHLAGYASRGLLKVDVAADGSFSTATATSISNVTYTASSNGFTRISYSFTPSASTTQLSMRLFPDRDNGTGTTIFFGAQLSNGQTVEKYIKTSGSTITELDRPQETLGNYIGIQNLLPFSEDLSEWAADGITATEIAGDNPLNDDGFYRVTASAGSKTITEITETNTPAIEAGDVFTASVYVKNVSVNSGGVVKLQLTRDAGGDYEQSEVTLNNTTDEWQRFTVTHTFAQAHTRLRVRLLTSSGLTSLSADVFGFQLVKGSSEGTYTKTIGTPNEANGFVTKWYDQSAAGSDQENFEQITASYQPLVVENGAIITGANGKPAIKWVSGANLVSQISTDSAGGSNSTFDCFFVSEIKDDQFIFFAASGTSPTNNYIVGDDGSTSTSIGQLGNANKTLRVNGVDYDPNDPELNRDEMYHLLSGSKLYSTVGGLTKPYTGTNAINLGWWGGSPSQNFSVTGLFQEILMYTGSQLTTRTGIETQMNNYYNMF